MPSGGQLGATQAARRAHPQVVAVHRDVERLPTGIDGALDLADPLRPAVAASGTPRVGMPSRTTRLSALVALEDFVGDTGQRTLDVVGIEDLAVLGAGSRTGPWRTSFPASPDGLKGRRTPSP